MIFDGHTFYSGRFPDKLLEQGFTHLIVEPGHAAASFEDGTPLFPENAGQEIFNHLQGDLKIEPVLLGPAAYFKELGRVRLVDEYADRDWRPINLTHAELRDMIDAGQTPDPRLLRPEVARILKTDHELYKTAKATNVTWHHASITKEDREAVLPEVSERLVARAS